LGEVEKNQIRRHEKKTEDYGKERGDVIQKILLQQQKKKG